ncbi:MAG: histidine kinase [Thiohalobacteraceae bacterium]
MFHWLKASLPARATLAVSVIVIFALASALSSGLIASLSKSDAGAINIAGSLRMATYRIMLQLESGHDRQQLPSLIDNLERRLQNPQLTHGLQSNRQLHAAYAALQQRWQGDLRPALLRGDSQHFRENAEDFVEQTNAFVLLLQQNNESKQSWLQAIQGLALFVTIMVLMVGLYQLQSTVLMPLESVIRASERFRAGDLSVRVDYEAIDELGQMTRSFNAMAEAVEQSHRTLERRVAEETANLARANGALQLLYQGSRRLASRTTNADSLGDLLDSFREHLPGLHLSLCLHGDSPRPTEQRVALHGGVLREICSPGACAGCVLRNVTNQFAWPVLRKHTELGQLRAGFASGREPQDWEKELLQALANLIGASLSLERQREQEHRLLLFEERAIIARELHDSLAQALSYMKLQISRLQTLIRRRADAEHLQTVSEEMRDGLNSAYRQLRELLTTFRLTISDGGLEQALRDTVREFAERGRFEVRLELQPLAFPLSANEQVHLLQIAREALSNCARHARASTVLVALLQQGECVELLIEDDGCGLSADYDQRQHHGLTIMRERARSLGGVLSTEGNHPHGTRIGLRFPPAFLGHPTHQAQELPT